MINRILEGARCSLSAIAPYSVSIKSVATTLVKAGLLGTVTELGVVTDSGDRYRAIWTTDAGNTATATFRTYAQAVKHLANHAGQALRFMISDILTRPGGR